MRKTLRKPSRKLSIRPSEDNVQMDWRDKLKPAVTLGQPKKEDTLAQDRGLSVSMSLLQHSMELGQMPSIASFMGYPALQDISQNGIIRACIETVADDMTREWGTVKMENDNAEVVSKINAQLRRFNIRKLFHQVSEMVGYFGGCLIFIDTGAKDAELQLPLNISDKSEEVVGGRVKRFTLIDPINVYPAEYNTVDPLKPDFYKPRYWYVMGKKVHASRMIRFVANEVPQLYKPVYNFFGIAQAQILWDYVIHFGQCREATAEIMGKYSMLVLKTNMTETLFQAGGTQEMERRLMLMATNRNNNSVYAIDKEDEDIVNISAPISGLTDITRQGLEFLAAINRTPAVKLLGISPSGFNATGESDLRNYYDHIKSQREKLFDEPMRKILRIIQLNTYGTIDPTMTFEWDELGQADEAAVAGVQKTKADMVSAYLDRNIISQEEARQFIVSDPDSGLNFIDPDETPEIEELQDPMMQAQQTAEPENQESSSKIIPDEAENIQNEHH